jgi:hypothetical protein
MRKTLIVAVLTLTACAQHVRYEHVTGPNGKPAIAMRCGNMPACFKTAGEMCPNGYERLDQQQTLDASGTFAGYGGGAKTRGSMLIQCK